MERFKRTLRHKCTCTHCGCDFMAFKATSTLCDKHRNVGRVWATRMREKPCIQCGVLFTGQGQVCSEECRKARHNVRATEWRRKKGIGAKRKAVKKRKVTSARILPVVAVVEQVVTRPVMTCYVQVDKKTRFEFSSEERRLAWMKRQAI